MKIAIGIDTGGTYTDGVLIDVSTKEILKTAKTPTTHQNLCLCIDNILNKLLIDEKTSEIVLISASTTLATNACVEKKFGTCKLILFGVTPQILSAVSEKYGLMSAEEIYFAAGSINIKGEIDENPDWEKFLLDIDTFIDDYDAFAIVQLWGTINPILEKTAKELISQHTPKPVVCGHELSSRLNFARRAASATLNAKLIPIFGVFMDSLKQIINKRSIYPMLCIVRGDGTIMNEEYARMKPVETLLSGPAASVLGSMTLCSNIDMAVVVDIGGTTTDIALLENKNVVLTDEGASIGDFRTATRAIDIDTTILGGDIELNFDTMKQVFTGNRRVFPLCALSAKYPYIYENMCKKFESKRTISKYDFEYYYLEEQTRKIDKSKFNEKEKIIVDFLSDGPKSFMEISQLFPSASRWITNMLNLNYLKKSCLTPTDIMHVKGDFCAWDMKAAIIAVDAYAFLNGYTRESMCEAVYRLVTEKLCSLIVKKLAFSENNLYKYFEKEILRNLICESVKSNKYLNISITTPFSIIGLGAPAGVFIPSLGKYFNTKCYVPENAQVGNAVGAVLGKISVGCLILVEQFGNGFRAVGSQGIVSKSNDIYVVIKDAVKHAEKNALLEFYNRGGCNPEIVTYTDEPREISDGIYATVKVNVYASCDVISLV